MHQDLPIRRDVHKEVLIMEVRGGLEVRPSSRYSEVCHGSAGSGWLAAAALTISSYSRIVVAC